MRPWPHENVQAPDGREPRDGFTLLELIVSITILGLIVGVLYGTLHVGLKSVDSSRSKSETFQRIRIAREILTRELRSAYLTPSSSDWTVFLGDEFFGKSGGDAGVGDEGRIVFRGVNDVRDGKPFDRLRFDTLADYPDGSLILTSVDLGLAPGREEGEWDLLLARNPRYGPWDADTVRLVRGVRELDIRYLKTDDENEPRWRDEWDSESELPEAIEIDLAWREDTDAESPVDHLPLLLYIPERPVR